MALTHVTLTDIFGASAVQSGDPHPDTTVTFEIAELGTLGNVTDSATLTVEGILLALMQKAFTGQGSSTTRTLELTRSTPIVTTRGGDTVRGERYVITIYSGDPVGILDPDNI